MNHKDHIHQINLEMNGGHSGPIDGYWKTRHNAAWNGGTSIQMANAVRNMILALAEYADGYRNLIESPIGEDGVLGEEWSAAAYAVRGLLNGELGGLDGGVLDKMLVGMLRREGFEK